MKKPKGELFQGDPKHMPTLWVSKDADGTLWDRLRDVPVQKLTPGDPLSGRPAEFEVVTDTGPVRIILDDTVAMVLTYDRALSDAKRNAIESMIRDDPSLRP
jgi:hypothetical protein